MKDLKDELWILYKIEYKDVDCILEPMINSAIKNGMKCGLYFFENFSIKNIDNKKILFYEEKELTYLPKVVFVRGYFFELFEYFEDNEVKVVNSTNTMKLVLDKYATHYLLSKYDIIQPKTIEKCDDYQTLVRELGEPFVMKDRFGAKGINVYLVENKKQFLKLKEDNKNISFIYQKYIKNSYGVDCRTYIVGNKIIGAGIRRSFCDFRSNISQGASFSMIDCSDELKKITLKIAKILNLEIGSIDYLVDDGVFVFCEANGNAGFGGFINCGLTNIRDKFMRYIKNNYFKS